MAHADHTPLLSSAKRHYASTDSVGQPEDKETAKESVHLKRHITLPYAVAIIVGNVIGSGIFLSPKGVTQNVGSVGGSLIIWGITGFYNLAQALCYAELGGVIPKSGGDYAYIYYILGPLSAFMCAWLHVVVIASSSCAVIARTAALYVLEPFELECQNVVIATMAVLIIVTLATANGISARLGTLIHSAFSVAKVIALCIIIVVGIIHMFKGTTESFQDPFANTSKEPGLIALAVLDGYFAYKGWELVNALPEEMVNPQRDLPIAVWIAMTLVTAIYVLTNSAYFAVLSPEELLSSDAVALTFAEKALSGAVWLIPLAVFLSCSGTVNGDFLSNSRYLFAGGRFKQVPRLFGMINIRLYTPLPAIAALCVIALLYVLFPDLQVMQEYASLSVQFKMVLVLSALLYLRWKKPDLHRPYKVNIIVVIITMIVMLALVGLSVYQSPVTSGFGVLVFAAGVPLYYVGQLALKSETVGTAMDTMTCALQRVLLVVPEEDWNLEDEVIPELKSE